VAERFVVLVKPGNAGGGKEPQFETDAGSWHGQEIAQAINSGNVRRPIDGVTRESEGGIGEAPDALTTPLA
jgi:hypothetical protein